MPIYKNNRVQRVFRGDHKPVRIYHGANKIAGWEEATATGQSVTAGNTYNDAAHVEILGNAEQNGTPSPDNPADIVPAMGILETRPIAQDAHTVSDLIASHGMKDALSMYINHHSSEDLTNVVNIFFIAAAESINSTYASEFYKYSVNPTSDGTKTLDNENLTCTPGTIASGGVDDYAILPLFACFDVNYTIDGTTLEPVIHAIKDVYGNFTSSPVNSFVGVMQMTGWVRRTSNETTKTVEYRAKYSYGFKPLPEAVRVDGSVRGFVVHAKYAAGYNSVGKLSSVSGAQPATSRSGSSGSTSISHNGQIAKWREWGNQYCGSSLCDVAFIQLMLEIKYATLGTAQVLAGCRSYSGSYTAAVAETGVTRVLLTAAQGAYFIVGSCVSLGSTNDRAKATTYDVCDITKILSIEDVTVDGTAYKAVNLDTDTPFNTTTATYIVAHPWQTGSTDDVLGNDGSPTNNTSGKEPCKIQGIEVMVGAYEVPGDTTLYEDAEKYTVYLNRKAADIKTSSSGTNPVTIGTIPKETDAGWKYVAELNWDANNQEAYMLAQTFAGSSSTGYRAGVYRDGAATTGWREWMAFGYLDTGGFGGFACAVLNTRLGAAYWNVASRACGSGGNRGGYAKMYDQQIPPLYGIKNTDGTWAARDKLVIDDATKTAWIERGVGVIAFDGTEDWTGFVLSTDGTIGRAYCDNIDYNVARGAEGICTHLAMTSRAQTPTEIGFLFSWDNRILIALQVKTIEEFKALLADQYTDGTPVTIAYCAATPTIEPIDYTAAKTYYPQTVIELTSNLPMDMTTTYKHF